MDDARAHQLTEAILFLATEIRESRHQRQKEFEFQVTHLATKHDLKELGDKIMSAISDFAAKQQAFNDRQDQAITDLQDDVKNLSDQITALQNSAGQITPEDQALLDAIQTRSEAITAKLEALDALTPPKPPTV